MDTLAPDMPSRRCLITLKFNYQDILSRSQVSQEKSRNVKASKISVYLCDNYPIPRKYTKILLREYRVCANLQHAVSPIDIDLEQMAAIQKRHAEMLRVAFACLFPVLR